MKKGVVLIVILIFVSWGCSENNSITEVVDKPNSSVAQNVTAEPNWIQLPAPKYSSLNKIFKKTKLIKANKDCDMEIVKDYHDVTCPPKVLHFNNLVL